MHDAHNAKFIRNLGYYDSLFVQVKAVLGFSIHLLTLLLFSLFFNVAKINCNLPFTQGVVFVYMNTAGSNAQHLHLHSVFIQK